MIAKIDPTKSTMEAQRWGAYLAVVEDGPTDAILARGREFLDPLLVSEGVQPGKRDSLFLRGCDIEKLADFGFEFLVLLQDAQRPHHRAFLARQLERVWTAIARRWRKDNAHRR